uniref:Uncharacterized protein n=1 Tax=Strigamia maritima TaxID=126957 RepID=T1IJ02_STRMM
MYQHFFETKGHMMDWDKAHIIIEEKRKLEREILEAYFIAIGANQGTYMNGNVGLKGAEWMCTLDNVNIMLTDSATNANKVEFATMKD